MSKHYTPSMKVKSGLGADGKFYIDVTSDDIGTVIVDGEAERIAWLLDLVRNAALEEAANMVEIWLPSVAAAIRALKDHSPQQDSN